MKKKVICMGAVVADLVALPVTSLPAPGGSARSPEITLHIGGCAANSATGLARLGREVHLCGAVGADPFGHFLKEALQREGVLLDHFQIREGHRTGSTFVINTEGRTADSSRIPVPMMAIGHSRFPKIFWRMLL